jgi:uncharacterized protein
VTRPFLALLLFTHLLAGLPEALAAVEVPSKPPARVTDLTRTLSRGDLERLEAKLAAFERETTHQLAVLIMPSLEGEAIESLGHRIAATWKLGQAGKDNGVLLLIAKSDRKLRIEVGYGLEGVLPDGKAGAIIREVIAPRFRRGEFTGGIEAGVEAIMAVTRSAVTPEAGRRPDRAARLFASLLPLLVAAVALALAFSYPLLRRFPDTLFWTGNGLGAAALVGFFLIDPAAWWSSLVGLIGVALGAVGSAGIAERHHCPAGPHWLDITRKPTRRGIELVAYDCPVCGYQRVDRMALAVGSGEWFSGPGWTSGGSWGSGGGFGGFSGGGGDFGGGGASGSW